MRRVGDIQSTEALPSGWVRHAAHNFEIGLPEDWIALVVSPEAIDSLIQELAPTNPDWVPSLEALKQQEALKFWALDPESPPGAANNLSVGYEVRLIPLDRYADVIRENLAGIGFTVSAAEQLSLGDYDALKLNVEGTGTYPSGEPLTIEILQVIVDDGGDHFLITLTYLPNETRKYEELFDSAIRTFRIEPAPAVASRPSREDSIYEQLLAFIPDTPENRSSVFINDYALLRKLFDIPMPGPDADEDTLSQFSMDMAGFSLESYDRAFPSPVPGPFISGFSSVAYRTPQFKDYLGFDLRDVNQSIEAGRYAVPLEVVRGRFDPELTTQALSI